MADDDGALTQESPKPLRWRRIVAQMRERDWIGIAIEFAIVTLGVLFAFQIDQWAQNWRQAREERQFLKRMWQETAEALEETEWVMTLHARFRREFIEGFQSLDDPAALQRLAQTPNVGCRVAVIPTLGFNNTSFQELSSSGRLNIISDPDIRAQLRHVVAAQGNAEALRLNQFQLSIDIQRSLDPYFLLGLDSNVERTCRMDWPRLARDPEARNALVRAVRVHNINFTRRAWVRDKLLIARNSIGCALGKPDCRPSLPVIFRRPPRYDDIPPEARDAVRRYAEIYSGT